MEEKNNSKLVLKVQDLHVHFGKQEVLDGLDFEVNKGEALAIVGPNGAGKTVLFKSLLGIIPYTGTIEWKSGVRLGYVPQRMEIETDVPLTVREFLSLRDSKNFSEDRAKESIGSVSLPESILEKGIGEISVGQRQRILIAWALLGNPNFLLFDEPTADIDISGQESAYQLIHNLQQKLNLTIILISHDLNVVYKHAHQVLCLNRQKICFGPPADVLDDKTIQKLYGGEHGLFKHDNEHKH